MADDDLSLRLHWPADPLEDRADDRAAEAAPRTRPAPAAAPDDVPAATPAGDDRGELALVRHELADLRHAVDDLADRVQMRQLRASMEELRSEVISLRRVVLEWPDLEQLTTEVGALRSQLVDLAAGPPSSTRATVDVTADAVAPLAEELAALRAELVSLRRRIALRGQAADAGTDDARLERIVETVVRRLSEGTATPARRRR
jgi:hypothetical protein